MKISAVKITLTEQDIMESIKEYIKIDNFDFENLNFDEKIFIKCTYKKGIKIALKVRINIVSVENNILVFSIEDINLAKVHIFNGIKNFALNKVLKDFEGKGITINKDTINVNLDTVLETIPSIKFKLTYLTIGKGELVTEVQDLVINKDNEEVKEGIAVQEVEIVDESAVIKKKEDRYTVFRGKIHKRIPEKYIEFSEYAFLIPDILVLFARLLKDKRVPIKVKAIIASIVTYFVSPIDIAILFIPFVGEISALALAFFGLSYVMKEVPEQIIIENWQGKDEFATKIKAIVEFVNKAAGGNNIERLIKFTKGNSMSLKNRR